MIRDYKFKLGFQKFKIAVLDGGLKIVIISRIGMKICIREFSRPLIINITKTVLI